MRSILLPILIMGNLALASCGVEAVDRYRERDGRAEAIADFRGNAPLRIYSRIFNGFAPGSHSPGLERCSPSDGASADAPDLFFFMPEAAFQEAEETSLKDAELASSAVRFARDYNQTMYRFRKPAVEAVCPKVRMERSSAK